MTVRTVGELKKLLQQYPDDLRLVGYNGSGNERPVSIYKNEPEDEKSENLLIVDTD